MVYVHDYLLFHVAKKFWVMRDSNIIHCRKNEIRLSIIYIQYMENGVEWNKYLNLKYIAQWHNTATIATWTAQSWVWSSNLSTAAN